MDALKNGQSLYKRHNLSLQKTSSLYIVSIQFDTPNKDNLLSKDKGLSQSILYSEIPLYTTVVRYLIALTGISKYNGRPLMYVHTYVFQVLV